MNYFISLRKTSPLFAALLFGALLWLPQPALAYVGPGAGLGMVGSFLAIAAAVIVTLLGVVIYPLRKFLKWRKERAQANEKKPDDPAES